MVSRKAQPNCLYYFLQLLRSERATAAGAATVEQLMRLLINESNFAKPTALETVQNAIQDGLLVPVVASGGVSAAGLGSPRGRLHEHKQLRLPEIEEITEATHDFYCFECHLPGILEHCRQCSRSFHRLCYRKDPERPNYTLPSAKLQKNRPPAFSSDTDSDSEAADTVTGSLAFDYESDVRASSSLQQLDQTSMYSWTPHRFVDDITVDSTTSPVPPLIALNEAADAVASTSNATPNEDDSKIFDDYPETKFKSKADVVCLGEVRPPTRKRPHTTASSMSYKSEFSPPNDEEESNNELCTCCRLLKYAALRNPPNLQADELCHLVGFTFERNRTWIAHDVDSYLESIKVPAKQAAIIKRLLSKADKPLESIEKKLNGQQYYFLTEFLVDILDIQHNIGVFFGPNSNELESTKWMVRDISYDLSEIRRCPDCFRYSHEKHSHVWFAKPCVQRHELVFAKHSSFPYWPAKVIRVLPNNKYDVRFFGGNHSRALIESRYIRPIDADIKSLKLGNTPAIKKALEELRYHQVLSTYPPSKFSFHADKDETEQIIRSVLMRTSSSLDMSAGRGRPKRSNATKRARQSEITNTVTTANESYSTCEQSQQADNVNVSETDLGYATKRARSNRTDDAKKRVTRSANSYANMVDYKQMQEKLNDVAKAAAATKKKYEKLLTQVEKLKDTIKKHENERKILKRKQWCYWCLNEAIYLCCFRAAYCSKVCQSRHWKDGHSKVCKNRDDQRQATSTT